MNMYNLHTLCVIGILSVTVCLVASECSGNGVKKADGSCNCNPDFYGNECECSSMDGLSQNACISPESTTPCSGRGKCVCGMCECHQLRLQPSQRYTGQYCQCDDYSCFYHNKRICGGNGRCVCGKCFCNQGFSGDACQYSAGGAGCLAPHNNGRVCDNHGECINGQCECDRDSIYTGLFCEQCPTCTAQCSRNYPCALCMAENDTDCTEDCGTTAVKMVDTLGGSSAHPLEKACTYQSSSNMEIIFTYLWKDGNYQVKVLNPRVETSSSSGLRYSSYVLLILMVTTMLF